MNLPFNYIQSSESGETSAYKNNFTGFYTPSGMMGSPNAYYYIMDHEVYEAKPTYSVEISSSLQTSSTDSSSLVSTFAGSFFPLISGRINTEVKISGRFPNSDVDRATITNVITGKVTNSNLDNFNQIIRFNGGFIKGLNDEGNFSTKISGGLDRALTDLGHVSCSLSGNVYKYEKDNLLLNVTMHTATFSRGYVKEVIPLTGDMSLQCVLANVFFSRAG